MALRTARRLGGARSPARSRRRQNRAQQKPTPRRSGRCRRIECSSYGSLLARISALSRQTATFQTPSKSGCVGTSRGLLLRKRRYRRVLVWSERCRPLTWQHRLQLTPRLYHPVSIINPRQCPTTWNSPQPLACMPVIFPGILHPTGACGCLETSRNGFSNGSIFELR
jgi:hypothetical protein